MIDRNVLHIDPAPLFDLSPYLYMQFMEPLGSTDASVEAGWDFGRHAWRKDLVKVTRKLKPPLIRLGGCFSSYYRWKEGVGPRSRRRPLLNMCWGGVETNQVGTHEFIDFCRKVGADPLLCVNFEADGKKYWIHTPDGEKRAAGPREAAEWVDYCNNPDNALRKKNGVKDPFNVKLWQVGNESSYGPNCFDFKGAVKSTLAFSRAMKRRDPSIELIGWGDSGWARGMLEAAGEHLSYIAFHHHFDSGLEGSPLNSRDFRKDPAKTWRHLMSAWKSTDRRIREMREETAGYDVPLAMTESHFALPGRNRCEVLSTWAAGVANARILNVHERHGDKLKIATLADFCGTRWMVNAIMIPVPEGRHKAYMMPVARVMALYGRCRGKKAVRVSRAPAKLDVTAGRTGRKIYLHVVNTDRTGSVKARVIVKGMNILCGRAFEIREAPMLEIDETNARLLEPRERRFPKTGLWSFPPASVTAVELSMREE